MTARANTSDYISAQPGLGSWLVTSDHKRIGILYLAATLAMLVVGGGLGVLDRVELLRPGHQLLSQGVYNQVFALHGVMILFLFLVPSVFAALGNFVLPLMIGAKDVAYPKLNLVSFYLYAGGGIFAIVSVLVFSVDTGWTLYTPYDTTPSVGAIVSTAAVLVLALSTLLTGVNFIATVRKRRAPGMTWGRLPLFVWGIYTAAHAQILATLLLVTTLVLLIVDKSAGGAWFDAANDGDPVLLQRFFWSYLHPAVYIALIPAMAVVSEIVSTFSRRRIFGYAFLAASTVALAIFSFLAWGQHLFATGMSGYAVVVFSGLAFVAVIPVGVKIVNWVATLYNGSISLESPMLYALGCIVLITIGMLSGLFVSAASVGSYLSVTYFAEAHFHYAVIGATAVAFIGGVHYWWPKMTGKMYDERLAKVAFGLIFVGFNLMFATQFLLGSRGMPRRSFDYADAFRGLQGLSSVGSFVLAIGVLVMLGTLIHSLRKGVQATSNPWGSAGFEWATSSPPAVGNFAVVPEFSRGPYDYHLATAEELSEGDSPTAAATAPEPAPRTPEPVAEEE